ncbi:MAG: DNA-3-methyladenine glycosylase [Sporichthyaceae bacterium]
MPLERAFFDRPVLEVAPDLLGCALRNGPVVVLITEVEAYAGPRDPASHAFRGHTPRNAVMFGEPGHLYVYRSHGLHWCVNITTGPVGEAAALLLRAGEVIRGVETARTRRGPQASARMLARGPGNLGQALGFDATGNGIDLCAGGPANVQPRRAGPTPEIARGPRVGVSQGADMQWRYWLAGDPTVSAYRRSPRALPPGVAPVRT